jgi:hypothetical protein
MKPMTMSRRDRRALFLGAAVLAPALLYIGAVKPFVGALGDARDRLAVEREALGRERALLSLAPGSDSLRTAVDSVVRVHRARLFEARDDGIAGAEFAAYLEQLARRSNVWLQEADARGAKLSPSGVRALTVVIRAESDYEGILTLLRNLETGRKLVRVERMQLAPGALPNDHESPRALTLRATLVGYALQEQP